MSPKTQQREGYAHMLKPMFRKVMAFQCRVFEYNKLAFRLKLTVIYSASLAIRGDTFNSSCMTGITLTPICNYTY